MSEETDKPAIVESSMHVCPGCGNDSFHKGKTRAERSTIGGFRFECTGCGWRGFGMMMPRKALERPLIDLREQLVTEAQASYTGDLDGQKDGLTEAAREAVRLAKEAQIVK
jgi:predicted RNA-binding Zn-ribbon protein involved in translation (DUF1610 family)